MKTSIKIDIYKIRKLGLEQFEVRVEGELLSTYWSLDKAQITVNTLKLKWMSK